MEARKIWGLVEMGGSKVMSKRKRERKRQKMEGSKWKAEKFEEEVFDCYVLG